MIWVSLDQLEPGMVLARDVVVNYPLGLLLLRRGQELTRQYLMRLKLFDVSGVYVRGGLNNSEFPDIAILDSEVKEKVLDELQLLTETITAKAEPKKVQACVETLSETVNGIIDTLVEQKSIMINILDLKSYDACTYHHSVGVSVLAVAMGLELGLSKETLNDLGMAAILHDIGKEKIPLQILRKPAKLTEEEFEMIKKHPANGEALLQQFNIGSEDVRMGVLCHHEKWDGNGYPFGLHGEKIPLFGRIIAVADVYEALTSVRPYRKPAPPIEVAEYLLANGEAFFDIEIVEAFMRKVELYPIGSCVTLSNGRKYVVIENRYNIRPKVQAIQAPYEVVDLLKDRDALHLTILE